jgi:hypothetical protein
MQGGGPVARFTRAANRKWLPLSVPHLSAVALLAVLLAVFFWRVTLEQRVLAAGDLVYTADPWKSSAPAHFEPSNPYQSDDAYIFYPRRYALYEGAGESWWQDDYISSDRSSFFIDSLGLPFYPPSLVYEVLPFAAANSVYQISVLLAAAISMYLLLWQLKFRWLPRVFGATIYMLNAHFIVWSEHPFLPASLGLVPLMLFGFERHRETREPLYLLLPASCLAIEVFLGYVPAWIVSGAILTLYGVVRLAPTLWTRRLREAGETIAIYTASAVLGLLMSAYSLVPSVASAAGSSYQTGRAAGLAHFPLESAWTYLFPDYWGTSHYWFGPIGNFPEVVGYTGITVVPLALLGFWQMRRHWLGWLSLLLVVFSASQVWGIEPLKELAHLPGIKQVAVGRWLFGINLAAALMAPAGVALLLDVGTDARSRRRLAGVVAGVVVIALLAVALLYLDRRDGPSWQWITEGRSLLPTPKSLVANYSTVFHRQIVFMLLGAAGIVFALLRPARAQPAACALLALVFLDLFAFGTNYDATAKESELYPVTPAISYLQQQSGFFRIAPVASDGRDQVFPGYTPNVYGLRTIGGYDHYRGKDYLDFLAPLQSQTDRNIVDFYGYVTIGSNRQQLSHNLLSLLGVRYIVTSPTGLWCKVGGQETNDTAFPVYGDVTQGETVSVPPGADSIEFLLATGGGTPPDSDIVFQVRNSATDKASLATQTIDARKMEDNSWQRLDLPAGTAGHNVFIEISAPTATASHPLLAWAVSDATSPDLKRYQSGVEGDGALTFRVLKAPGAWAKQVYSGSDAYIYEVQPTLPFAWGTAGEEVLPDRSAVLSRIADDSFDPSDSVVFAAEDVAPNLETSGQPGGTFQVDTLDSDPDSFRLRTQFSQNGWLVLSQTYDSAWRASVDGEDVGVLRGDDELQVVPVPAGEHTVKMTFSPTDYIWGRRITEASLGLTALAVVVYLVWYRRRRPVRNVEAMEH